MLGLGLGTSKGGFVDALAEVTNTKSIDFDGTNDILTLPASSSLGNANLSISAWFKTTSSDRIYLFQLIRSGSTTSTSVAISINQKASDQSDVAGYITGIVFGSSHGFFGSSSPVNANDGNWHHIVLTITDGSQKMYLDSQEIASGTLSYTASFSNSAGNIGNDQSNSYEILGNVDEVAIWHDILTQNEVTQIYNTNKATLDLSTDTGDYSSSANLKMWLRMGDGDTFPIIQDQTSNNNDGTMTNMTSGAIETDTPTQIYTVANTKSVLFDQTDDFIQFGDLDVVTDNFTISGWVKPTDASDFGVIMSKYDDNTTYKSDRVFRIVISGSVCICTIKKSSGNNLATSTTTTTLSDGEWFHFAFTNDGSNLKGYINGVLEDTDSTASGSLNSSNQNFLIGAQYVNTVEDNEFGGNIDEVGIWNEALTASEVAQIYHGSQANFDLSQNGGGYTSASNLQAWWRMGDGTIDDFTLIGDQTDTSLQSNIIDNTKFFREEDGTSGGWTPYGSNSVSVTSDSVTITHGSHAFGARITFKQTGANSCLTENLVVDQVYKFSCTISSLTDNDSDMKLNVTGASETSEVLSNGDAVIYFRASHATSNIFRLNGLDSGETVTISNPSLQKVNGNAGIMKNMASNAIETDTP